MFSYTHAPIFLLLLPLPIPVVLSAPCSLHRALRRILWHRRPIFLCVCVYPHKARRDGTKSVCIDRSPGMRTPPRVVMFSPREAACLNSPSDGSRGPGSARAPL